MKAKHVLWALTVWMICLIFSTSQGANKFYFGSYDGDEYPSDLKDSLKFNIVRAMTPSIYIDGLVAHGIRAIALDGDNDSPSHWSWISHYTLWEAEGYPTSYYGFTYNGGSWAEGGKARYFKNPPDVAGLIQTGPGYQQEPGPQYTAEFRLKSPLYFPSGKSGGPPVKLCSLMVVGNGQVLAQKIVYHSDFNNIIGYKSFNIQYYVTQNPIEFQIYWFGNRQLYIDYVKTYDDNGRRLMKGEKDSVIIAYASKSWVTTPIQGTGEPVIYRWYMRDEPPSLDYYAPTRYVDSLLKQVSTERVGLQAFWWAEDSIRVNEYLLRQNPTDLCFDIFPMGEFGDSTTGAFYQQQWDDQIKLLNFAKNKSENLNKDFWFVPQAWTWSNKDSDTISCHYHPLIHWGGRSWCPGHRDPSRYELRLETFLGMCYGADAILYFNYNWFIDNNGNLLTGLWEPEGDTSTYKWREIKEFIGPRVEKLGPILNQITWEGACSDDEVGSFVLRNETDSYIDSIVGQDRSSTYVQIGFFIKPVEDSLYFMLVNRKCLPGENEDLKVYFNLSDGPYLVKDMYTDITLDKICGFNPFEVSLQPGEGKLFKLEKFPTGRVLCVRRIFDWRCHYYPAYSTIQNAINAAPAYPSFGFTVLVDTGTYYENINFIGKNITLASRFHLDQDTSHINRTIIDGSALTSGPDFGSVVRFISGENRDAVLKGFTIRHGKGSRYISKDRDGTYGGGIYCKNSSPTIINNVITEDTALYGDGGGIYCCESSPQILNNWIEKNVAGWYGGGIAISNYSVITSPILINNIIVKNVVSNRGGGIYYQGDPIIMNNTIDSNSAPWGGGINLGSGSLGCIENNIISNSLHGGGIGGEGGPAVFSYNDVWNNTGGDFNIGYPESVGVFHGLNNRNGDWCDPYFNISENPYFYDGYHSGYCIDAGDSITPYLLPTDFEGNPRVVNIHVGYFTLPFVDMGAYEFQVGGGMVKLASSDTSSGRTQSSLSVPNVFQLSQNYPNPFNPVANISFTVGESPSATPVTLRIYNITGQLVRTLVDEEKIPGKYTVTWDGKNSSGEEVASGIYFYQLNSNNFKETKRMTLIK